MDKNPNIDLKKYISKPVSKWYLVRVIFYVIMLGMLGYLLFFQYNQTTRKVDSGSIEQIDGVTILQE